jgi:hypothetical protein
MCTTYTHNATAVGVVVVNKKRVSPNVPFVYSATAKYMLHTEIIFVINMEDDDDC